MKHAICVVFNFVNPPLCSPSRNYQALDLRIEWLLSIRIYNSHIQFVFHLFITCLCSQKCCFNSDFFLTAWKSILINTHLIVSGHRIMQRNAFHQALKIIEEWILKTEMAYNTTLSKESSPSSSYYFIIILFVLITPAQSGRNETTLPKKILIRWMEIYTLSNTCL